MAIPRDQPALGPWLTTITMAHGSHGMGPIHHPVPLPPCAGKTAVSSEANATCHPRTPCPGHGQRNCAQIVEASLKWNKLTDTDSNQLSKDHFNDPDFKRKCQA